MARLLGIDVDDGVVRGALVRSSLRKVELEALRELTVPDASALSRRAEPEAADDDASATERATSAVIADLVASFSPPPDGVIIGISGLQASVRELKLPQAATRRVSEVVPFELEALTPFELDDVVISYQAVARDEATITLLAATAKTADIRGCLARCQDVSVDPRELTLNAVALESALPLLAFENPGAPLLLVNIRRHETDLCLVHENIARFARTLSYGSDDLTRPTSLKAFQEELKRSVASFRAAEVPLFEHFIALGEIAVPVQAHAWLAEITGLQPLAWRLKTGEQLYVPPDFQRFGLAVALATRTFKRGRRIDFRQGPFARARAAGALRKHARLALVAALGLSLSLLFALVAEKRYETARQEALSAALATKTAAIFGTRYTEAGAARTAMTSSEDQLGPLPRFDAYSVIDALSAAIATSIRHDTRRLRIEIDDENRSGKVYLEGNVESVARQEEIAAALEQHACFKDITKGDTSPAGPGKTGIFYSITSAIRCGEVTRDEDEGRGSSRRRRERSS